MKIIEKLQQAGEWLEDERNHDALRMTWKQLCYLLRHLRFRRLRGELSLGVEEPAQMGQLLSLLAILYPLYAERVAVEAVFDENVLEGELSFCGHFRLVHLVWALLCLYVYRPTRRWLRMLMGEKNDK